MVKMSSRREFKAVYGRGLRRHRGRSPAVVPGFFVGAELLLLLVMMHDMMVHRILPEC
jgi:hypothetical protein